MRCTVGLHLAAGLMLRLTVVALVRGCPACRGLIRHPARHKESE